MQSTFTLGQEIMQSFVLPDHTAAPAMREGGTSCQLNVLTSTARAQGDETQHFFLVPDCKWMAKY